MDVVGIGTHILDCPRVRKLIDRHGETFLAQVYTAREVRHCNGTARSTLSCNPICQQTITLGDDPTVSNGAFTSSTLLQAAAKQ